MTTNAKHTHYVEIGETVGAFLNRVEDTAVETFRPMFTWGERYWKTRNNHGQYLPA